jgi:uncharacterized repeat protein (TIGR03803 family)
LYLFTGGSDGSGPVAPLIQVADGSFYGTTGGGGAAGHGVVFRLTVPSYIQPGIPTVAWPNPAPISYGMTLTSNQLNATASVPGTFAYSPTNGTILSAGTNTLSVLFAPTDTNNYQSVTASVNLVVTPATPLVTWPSPPAISYGTGLTSNQLNATANVPGSFAYNPTNGAILSAGTNTLSAFFTPADTNDYQSVTATVTLVVTPAIPLVMWLSPPAISYGTGLTSNQLNATANVPGSFAYNPTNFAIPSAGTNTLSAFFTPADTNDYQSVTATVTLVVTPAIPLVMWLSPPAISYGTALTSNQLNATANVPGSFAYTPTNGSILSAGTNTLFVLFTPADTNSYQSVTATASLVVSPATPLVTWPSSPAISYGTALSSNQLSATASVPGSFAYTPTNGTILNAGTNTLSLLFTPADTNDYQSIAATQTILVTRLGLAIQFEESTSDGTLTLRISTPLGVAYVLESILDLNSTNWTAIATNEGDGTTQTFNEKITDTQRFYRVRQ